MRNPSLFISIILIALLLLREKVFADTPDECSKCWIDCRNKIKECQNIPEAEIEAYKSNTQYVLNKTDFPTLIGCFCALSNQTDSILAKCNCPPQFAEGLGIQSKLVAKEVCLNSTVIKNIEVNLVDSSSSTTSSSISSTAYALETKTSSVTATTNVGGGNSPDSMVASASSIGLKWTVSCLLVLLASLFNI